MAEKKDKPKTEFEEEIRCPHCKEYIEVKKIKTLTNEPVKAEYDEKLIVRKSVQKRLKE